MQSLNFFTMRWWSKRTIIALILAVFINPLMAHQNTSQFNIMVPEVRAGEDVTIPIVLPSKFNVDIRYSITAQNGQSGHLYWPKGKDRASITFSTSNTNSSNQGGSTFTIKLSNMQIRGMYLNSNRWDSDFHIPGLPESQTISINILPNVGNILRPDDDESGF